MKTQKTLIVVSAPSGAGKTTLCSRLLQRFPQLTLSISTTTRAPRGAETHGREYFFVSRDEFRRGIDRAQFAEWAEVHGNFYGTARETLDRARSEGRVVLLDIDVQGAESLRRAYPVECFTVFIAPPSLEALEARLRGRGTDREEVIARRMNAARLEMAEAPKFDCVIVNDCLERATEELEACIARVIAPPSTGQGPGAGPGPGEDRDGSASGASA